MPAVVRRLDEHVHLRLRPVALVVAIVGDLEALEERVGPHAARALRHVLARRPGARGRLERRADARQHEQPGADLLHACVKRCACVRREMHARALRRWLACDGSPCAAAAVCVPRVWASAPACARPYLGDARKLVVERLQVDLVDHAHAPQPQHRLLLLTEDGLLGERRREERAQRRPHLQRWEASSRG
eukprot:4592744-Prymnesium_polylepis.1